MILTEYKVPSQHLVSGCSFSNGRSNVQDAINTSGTWPDWLCRKVNPDVFSNLSVTGGGNNAIVGGLTFALATQKVWNPEDTVIIFNITGLERIDLICEKDHPEGNRSNSWYDLDLLPFKYIISGGWNRPQDNKQDKLFRQLEMNQQFDPLCLQNSMTMMNFMLSLDAQQFRWYFMIMDHEHVWNNCPKFFQKFLQKRNNWIKFGQYDTMREFCSNDNMLDADNFHPSRLGHQKIAEHVWSIIEKHY